MRRTASASFPSNILNNEVDDTGTHRERDDEVGEEDDPGKKGERVVWTRYVDRVDHALQRSRPSRVNVPSIL